LHGRVTQIVWDLFIVDYSKSDRNQLDRYGVYRLLTITLIIINHLGGARHTWVAVGGVTVSTVCTKPVIYTGGTFFGYCER